jgi:hypothetical protein
MPHLSRDRRCGDLVLLADLRRREGLRFAVFACNYTGDGSDEVSGAKRTQQPWLLEVERRDGVQLFTVYAPNGPGAGGTLILDGVPIEGFDDAEELAIAHLIAAAPELLDAAKFLKGFLVGLENSTEPYGDPLYEVRRRIHAPLHEKLDAALIKAGCQI